MSKTKETQKQQIARLKKELAAITKQPSSEAKTQALVTFLNAVYGSTLPEAVKRAVIYQFVAGIPYAH